MTEKKPKSIFRRITRLVMVIILAFALIILLTGTAFYIYKDTIAKNLLLGLNSNVEGVIQFSGITFNPFVQFPSISVQLNDFYFYEKDSTNIQSKLETDTSNILGIPVARFEYVYAAIDILDLIKGKIDVSKVAIKNGEINIIKYPDSTFNFYNAIKLTFIDSSDHIQENEELLLNDSVVSNQELDDLNLLLERISFKNIQIEYIDSIDFDHKKVRIDKLQASLEYLPDSVAGEVDVQLQLLEFGITRAINLSNKHVKLDASINYDRKHGVLDIIPSILRFEDAIFNFSGYIDLKNKGFVDLIIDGSDRDFGFSKILLTESGINHIKQGELYFNGTIKGNLTSGIPMFDFAFGIKDVDLHVPTVENEITDINFDGKFISGTREDLSHAKLFIKDIRAQLPGGYLAGTCNIKNFKTPDLILDWEMKADVTGFDDIFKLDFIDSLSGNIEIIDHLVAKYDPDLKWILDESCYTILDFDHLSFDIPGILEVNNINGVIKGGNDTVRLDSFKIQTGNTDLLIDGEVHNLLSMFLKNDKPITADLTIKSDIFDLSELLAYDPRVGENFPYQIVDVDLLVEANTTADKLIDFYSNPEIDFEIQHLDATIQDFLPSVSISKGLFKLHEKDERVLLNFSDFDIKMAGSKILADVEYYSPPVLPDYVKTIVQLEDLVPAKVFYPEPSDSIQGILNGSLSGSLICDVTLPSDTNVLDKVFIDRGNLEFKTKKDTFKIESLFLEAENIFYDFDVNPNPFATLTTECIINADEINTGILKVENVQYDIDVKKGEFIITPKKISFFGEEGHGIYILKPYIENPTYELQYSVEQFQVEDLLKSFLEDTIITGKADFRLDITLAGDHWDSVVSNINGELYLSGNDLTLYGLDADKLIEKLKRSQNFNLVDVGAVLLAGPVGLAVTKGSDFARIIVTNPGERTNVSSFISDWSVEYGRLNMDDVAFSTENNRIAALGWIDLKTDSLNITIAAINDKGCSIMSQDLYGQFEEPEMSDVKVVKSLLAPVTNLVKGAVGVKCKAFYEGKVKHPEKQKKQ